jgi:hypothetical protein
MKFVLWGWDWHVRYDRPSEHKLDGALKRCWWFLWQWRTPYTPSWCCVRILGITLYGREPRIVHSQGTT